jgi:hypothetical protein
LGQVPSKATAAASAIATLLNSRRGETKFNVKDVNDATSEVLFIT